MNKRICPSNEEKRKPSHEFNEILIAFLFNLKPCTSSDFTWSYDEKYDNCYTFNSDNELKKSFLVGPEFGLQITLFTNVYEKHFDSLNGLGALIRIRNSSYTSFYSNGGHFLSPGYQTNILVEREFKHMLPSFYKIILQIWSSLLVKEVSKIKKNLKISG